MKENQWEVWGIPPWDLTAHYFASYTNERWQWAMKLVWYLEEKGYRAVEVRKVKGRGIKNAGS